MAVGKPAGPTSHDVVDAVRRTLRVARVGHLGTLDPFADGVLVVLVGRATRLARFAAGWLKSYAGVIRLGTTTTTDDGTGAPLARSDAWRELRAVDVEAALAYFRGAITQRPPAFSAVKVAGERAYRRARRGEAVALAPRPVTVTAFALEAYDPPDVRFSAAVSAGTYLRALARDVGDVLGCGAHLAALTRTAVGPFSMADAVPPDGVAPERLRPLDVLVRDLPRRDLTAAERDLAVHGRPIAAGTASPEGHGGEPGDVALLHNGVLVAVAEVVEGWLRPRVVVAEPA